jgi:hypothetical protein
MTHDTRCRPDRYYCRQAPPHFYLQRAVIPGLRRRPAPRVLTAAPDEWAHDFSDSRRALDGGRCHRPAREATRHGRARGNVWEAVGGLAVDRSRLCGRPREAGACRLSGSPGIARSFDSEPPVTIFLPVSPWGNPPLPAAAARMRRGRAAAPGALGCGGAGAGAAPVCPPALRPPSIC